MTKAAGDFNQIVVLKKRATNIDGTPVVDELGQAVKPWVTHGPAFARVSYIRGDEGVEAAAHVDGEVVEAFIRRRPGIDTTWGFMWLGRHWDILSLLPVTGTHDIRLIATSGGKVNPR
jgi:head-tail adaptor